MKYREGNLVRIKPKTWWNELEKDGEGDAIFKHKGGTEYFTKEMADECCSRIGEIINSGDEYRGVLIDLGDEINYFCSCEEWIEGRVEKIDIHLKQMKSDV